MQGDEDVLMVDASIVLQVAKSKWEKIDWYKDRLMTVFEVKETFPTMFFMQEVTQVYEVRIDCVSDSYWRIKDAIVEYKNAYSDYKKCLQ